MSSLLINFWPIKKFLTYVFKRSFGKFFKNELDLDLYDFTKKKITFKNLDLNTQLINENLKDSPFKVICCNIGSLKIIQPSLNFLTQKINIEVSNVDLILMPTFSEGDQQKQRTSSDGTSEIPEDSSQANKDEQKSEEFNILNNLVNKILQNLEVNITSIAIRVLTKEISQDLDEIPTLLLRLNSIEYKRVQDVNPERKPASDTQVIVEGKCLEVSEISLHFMKSASLYPDEFHQKLPHQQKYKFPFQYPVVNHPNTILLVKPVALPLSLQQSSAPNPCLSVKFEFPPILRPNTLQLTVQLPNIELMLSFNQLKGLLTFSKDISSFYDRLDCPAASVTPLAHQLPKQRLDEDTLDLYGTMIRTNQTFKEVNFLANPKLKKAVSQKVENKVLTQEQLAKNKIQQSKVQLRKEKLIYSFLQKTQDKKEFQKLKAELQHSIMSQSQDDAKLLESSGLMQSPTDNSQSSSMLELLIKVELHKASIFVICNEGDTQYDHVFDSISSSLVSPGQNGQTNNNHIDERSLRRYDQKIPHSHYNLEIRRLGCEIIHKQVKIKSKKPANPFAKTIQKFGRDLTVRGQIHQFQLNRYDLIDNQLQYQQSSTSLQSQISNNDTLQLNSQMFHSAAEFYQLDESRVINQSSLKRGGGGHGIEQSSLLNHESTYQQVNKWYVLVDLFRINPQTQHFCMTSIIDIRPLIGCDTIIMTVEIFLKNGSEINTNGKVRIGRVNVNFGWDEALTLLQLSKSISFAKGQAKAKPKSSKQKAPVPNLSVAMDGLSLQLHHTLLGTEIDEVMLNFLSNQTIDQLKRPVCNCSGIPPSYSTVIGLEVSQALITMTNQVTIKIDSVDLDAYFGNCKLPLIGVPDVTAIINMVPEQQVYAKTEQKARKPFKMFENERDPLIPHLQKEDSKTQEDIMHYKSKTQINLQIRLVHINLEMQHMEKLSKVALDTEYAIKLFLILQESVKCYKLSSKVRQIQPPLQSQYPFADLKDNSATLATDGPESISFELIIEDIQIILSDSSVKQHEPGSSFLFSQTVPLLAKLRIKNLQLSLRAVQKDQKEKLQLCWKIEDLFLLDFSQQLITFHPQLLKKSAEIISIQPKKDNHIAQAGTNFYDELNISAPFVLFYKQQGIKQSNLTSSAFNIDISLQFILEQKTISDCVNYFQQQVYMDQTQPKKLLQIYEEVNQLKKNPMVCSIVLSSTGIVQVFPSQFGLLESFKTYKKDVKAFLKENRVAPKVIPQEKTTKIKVSVNLFDFMIDYSPMLTKENYNKIINKDAILTSFKEDQTLYKTAIRSAIYLNEISIKIAANQDQSNDQEFTAKGLQFSMLENNIFTEQYNPVLLLDHHNSLDQTGGASLLDQLGFIQLLTIDILELSNTVTQEQFYAGGIDVEGQDEEEEDLFETSYGLQTLISKSKQQVNSEKQVLKLMANKICLYLAKDSLNTVKKLGSIIDKVVDDINMVTSIRKKKKSKNKQNPAFNIDDEQEQDGFQRVLEQFLFMDYNEEDDEVSFTNFEREELKEKGRMQQESSSFIEQDPDYFKLTQINNAQEILVATTINLLALVKSEYIPELNQNLIDKNRYKNCHLLPRELTEMNQRVSINIEVHSIDFKLYEGLDFNFDNAPKTNILKSDQVSLMESSFTGSVQQSTLYNVDEDYLALEKEGGSGPTIKKAQSSKRPKSTHRGNYFQLYLRNQIFSFSKLIDQSRTDLKIDRHCFSIEQLMIRETLSKRGSSYKELLQLPFDYQYDNQIQITLQRDVYNHCEEQSIKIKMQPFKLVLNQTLISFFQEFFNLEFKRQTPSQKVTASMNRASPAQSNMQSAESKPVYIKELKIFPLQAVLSYSSESLNFFDLTSGNKVELLNIFNIRDLKLSIKEYDLQQRIRRDQAFKHMLEFYKDDLVNNQKVSFMKAIGPLRSFANVAGAFYGVFKKPYIMYQQDKSVVKGMGAGVYGLFRAIGEETSYLASNVAGKNKK